MKLRGSFLSLLLLICPALAISQSEPVPRVPPSVLVKAGRLLDVHKGTYIENAGIWIEGERIKEVGGFSDVQSHAPKVKVIDLGRATVLPGLIDCHTHLMARIVDSDDGYALTLVTKSQAFRALEGAFDARLTLNAGFTSVRDVESEGSGYADVALRDAISQGLAEGPRMQVATRGIAAVGQYEPFGISPDLPDFPTGAQMVSGIEDARRAVREQIGHGADLIKVYADWQHPTLTVDEMRVIVEEAHKQKLKVAAHATTAEGIKNAITAGVDSIEHGFELDADIAAEMARRGCALVTTMTVLKSWLTFGTTTAMPRFTQGAAQITETLATAMASVRLAQAAGVAIVGGTDFGGGSARANQLPWEIECLVQAGLEPWQALASVTWRGGELLGEPDAGVVREGGPADFSLVHGDPLSDPTAMWRVWRVA